MSCLFCGKYLGCYECNANLNRCPIYRRELQCNICQCNFPKNLSFTLGIGEYLYLPEVRRAIIDKRNESTGSSSQAGTIPATDNLPDLEPPGTDETLQKERILGDIYSFPRQAFTLLPTYV